MRSEASEEWWQSIINEEMASNVSRRDSITNVAVLFIWPRLVYAGNRHKYITSNQRAAVVDVIPPPLATMDTSKPIAFCEHLQLSSLGVQPASISFQVR